MTDTKNIKDLGFLNVNKNISKFFKKEDYSEENLKNYLKILENELSLTKKINYYNFSNPIIKDIQSIKKLISYKNKNWIIKGYLE